MILTPHFMKPNAFYTLSGFIFVMVGVLHLLRFLFQWPVTFGTWPVPLWVSPVAAIFAWWLGFHAFKLRRGK